MSEEKKNVIEKNAKTHNGWTALILTSFLYLATIAGIIIIAMSMDNKPSAINVTAFVFCIIYISIIGWIPFLGLKIIKPNEALVLTLFGKYVGSIKKDGFYFVNPFCVAVKPSPVNSGISLNISTSEGAATHSSVSLSKKISLKAMTLNNQKQKINDELGNPIEVGIIVIWKVVNTAKAVFNVDDFEKFISIQADSTLRDVVRQYPYDTTSNKMSLRESSSEIAEQLKSELQLRVNDAGLEIIEARITHLAYAPEIAAAMLQRQQASAIIDARQIIVEGAVGMVEMALKQLNDNNICELDEERKAAMVSNLLVVLCANKDAQPVVNSGSIY